MKRAVLLPEFSDVKPFSPPQGVVRLTLDKNTNQVATPACPDDYTTAFIDGTQPTQTCDQSADHGNIFQRVFGLEPKPGAPVSNAPTGVAAPGAAVESSGSSSTATTEAEKNKKRGFWGRLFGGSNSDKKDDNKDKKPAATPSPQP
jgi:penicillin-binding protein 1B